MQKKSWILIACLTALVILLVALKKAGVIGKDEALKVSTEKVVAVR